MIVIVGLAVLGSGMLARLEDTTVAQGVLEDGLFDSGKHQADLEDMYQRGLSSMCWAKDDH